MMRLAGLLLSLPLLGGCATLVDPLFDDDDCRHRYAMSEDRAAANRDSSRDATVRDFWEEDRRFYAQLGANDCP